MSVPVVHQYSVFDEVEDVVEVGQVSDVDNLPPEGKDGKKEETNKLSKKAAFASLIFTFSEFVRIKTAELKTEELK